MAEVFGIVSGALSVASLFNNCVDCFEYIQLGRHFGSDFERYQLQLDVSRVRLSRWGAAVRVNQQDRFDEASPDPEVALARDILEDIRDMFQNLHQKSSKYRSRAALEAPAVQAVADPETMSAGARRLHGRLMAIARSRQKTTSLSKKVSWAIYDQRHFGNMVRELAGHINALEKLFPVGPVAKQLAQVEVDEVNEEPELEALRAASTEIDGVLARAAEEKHNRLFVRHVAENIEVEGHGKTHFGSNWRRRDAPFGVFGTHTNTLKIRGAATVQVGFNFEDPTPSTTEGE